MSLFKGSFYLGVNYWQPSCHDKKKFGPTVNSEWSQESLLILLTLVKLFSKKKNLTPELLSVCIFCYLLAVHPNVPGPHSQNQGPHRTNSLQRHGSSPPPGLAKWFGSDVLEQPLPSMPAKVISVDELELRPWENEHWIDFSFSHLFFFFFFACLHLCLP